MSQQQLQIRHLQASLGLSPFFLAALQATKRILTEALVTPLLPLCLPQPDLLKSYQVADIGHILVPSILLLPQISSDSSEVFAAYLLANVILRDACRLVQACASLCAA